MGAGLFDAEARHYDLAHAARTAEGHGLRARANAVLGLLAGTSGSVLDAGMGPGHLVAELDRRGWTVSGVDASPAMVQAARSKLPAAAERLSQARLEQLPFADASFDAVTAIGVLEFVDHRDAVLCELMRVLRPEGIAIVSAPNVTSPYLLWRHFVLYPLVRVAKRLGRFARPAPPPRALPPRRAEFEQRLSAAGLEVTAARYSGYQLVLSPLELVLPRASVALSERLEGGPLGSMLATQIVFAARRRPASVS
jgi:ubiquinone/menaquinone biosynthesis C-methylase UbiE